MSNPIWIWQSMQWPNLTYDLEQLAKPLGDARREWGRLLARAELVTAEEMARVERDIWSEEALSTTAIMESAVADWDSKLDAERLSHWQGALFARGGSASCVPAAGGYRSHDPMDHKKAHYFGPPAAAVGAEIHNFAEWFNRTRGTTLDGILRAGIAHVWFESIHPFADGNGRVGRAVIDMALAQDARGPTRLHGVSTELRRRQQEYYETLNQAQRGTGDVTSWLVWFTNTFTRSCHAGAELIGESLVRARFWSDHRHATLNKRQCKVLNEMLDAGPRRFEGGLTQRKYASMTGASPATAWRDIEDMLKDGIIVRSEAAGRSTHYNLALPGWGWSAHASTQS
jgi:Fic family protein